MREFKITLPIPPSVNSMYATFRGRRILSKKGRLYKKTVAEILDGIEFEILEGNLKLVYRLYRARKSGDLDNFCKGCQDSLSKILYQDDKQITEIHAFRFDDKENPRIEVEVYELGSD